MRASYVLPAALALVARSAQKQPLDTNGNYDTNGSNQNAVSLSKGEYNQGRNSTHDEDWRPMVAGPRVSKGCETELPWDPVQSEMLYTISHNGLQREYRILMPRDYKVGEAAKSVVLSFHDFGGSASSGLDDLRSLAEVHDGPIVIAPQGISLTQIETVNITQSFAGWNAVGSSAGVGPLGPTCSDEAPQFACHETCGTSCHRCQWTSCADDVGFVVALLADVEARLCVDPKRIFATGQGNGAQFIFELSGDPRSASHLNAVAPLNGLPHMGFLRSHPRSAAPRFLGIWQGASTSRQDSVMPPLNNVPDKLEVSLGQGRYYSTMANTTDFWARCVDCTDSANERGVEIGAAAAALLESRSQQLTCLGLCGGRVIQCLTAGSPHPIGNDGFHLEQPLYESLIWDFFSTGLGVDMVVN